MHHPDQSRILIIDTETSMPTPTRRACLVAGCPCKDARIVSHRRAAFFADLARRTGETADRVVPADPEWVLPAPLGASFVRVALAQAAAEAELSEAVAA